MNSQTAATIVICSLLLLIAVFFIIGALKDMRDSMKKLNQHEDLRKRRRIPESIRPPRRVEFTEVFNYESDL